MKHLLLSIFAVLFSVSCFAQVSTPEKKPEPQEKVDSSKKKEKKEKKEKKDKKEKEIKAPAPKVESKSKPPKVKVPYRFMFNVHGGIGITNYFGDIRDEQNTTVHKIGTRPSFNFGIGGDVTNWLELNVDVLMGSMTWNQVPRVVETGEAPLNFEAEIFTAGANLTYNFRNFFRDYTGITPFVSAGVSYSDYDVYTDRMDEDGNIYHYWDDNSIRNVDQQLPMTDDIVRLQRDFKYETTEIKDKVAVTIPVGLGFDFNANRNVALRVGAYYYFTTTDEIDTKVGGDNGFFSKDGFLYTSLALYYKFDPFKKKVKNVVVPGEMYSGLGNLEEEDSDGDGVTDFFDKCEGTPKGISVDDAGCPADDDKDGIPNYRDKELNTPAGKVVSPEGIAVSYKDIYNNYGSDTISLMRKNVSSEWLNSQPEQDSKYTVHVGTYTNYDIPTQLKIKLSKMEGLVEQKLNDSVSVFTVGQYDDFALAEKKKNELISSGIDDAFGVNQSAVSSVSEKLNKIKVAPKTGTQKGATLDIENKEVLVYGVELREYRLRIQLDKLSKLIGQHGVEMKATTGGLKVYTIGSFSSYNEAVALRKEVMSLGVKNPEITAKHNNKVIGIDEARELEKTLNPKD